MNNEKNKLIEMLGKNIEIEDIDNKNIANDVLCGKFKFDNVEINAYIIGEKHLKNKQISKSHTIKSRGEKSGIFRKRAISKNCTM